MKYRRKFSEKSKLPSFRNESDNTEYIISFPGNESSGNRTFT